MVEISLAAPLLWGLLLLATGAPVLVSAAERRRRYKTADEQSRRPHLALAVLYAVLGVGLAGSGAALIVAVVWILLAS